MNMTPERWQQVEDLFATAKEVSPAEVDSWLRQECGADSELEREVASLLEYHHAAEGLLGDGAQPWEGMLGDVTHTPTFAEGAAFGPYLIRGLVGSGGMGDVYLAEDTRLHRKVALKLLPSWLSREERLVTRFTHEALAASALNHPNVPVVYEAGEIDRQHFIASEYVDGAPLTRRLTLGIIPWRESVSLALQVAHALEAAHAAGIVHRDVKPGNILVSGGDGRVKLVDFGVAKLAEGFERKARERTALTVAGMVIGTPGYMAPEQAAGTQTDGRSDIWSLAAVLHEMVTGRPPIPGSTMVQAGPNLPSSLAKVLERALQADPDNRYPTVAEFANTMERAQRGFGPMRRPVAWMLAGVTAAAVAGIGFFLFAKHPQRVETGFKAGQIVRLTTNGHVRNAAISADSRFVAYSVEESGNESLRLHEVDTEGDDERIPARTGDYLGLTFDPDGKYIYYTFDAHDGVSNLFRASVLRGGPDRKIVDDIDSPASVSPDGRQIAFIRGSEVHKDSELHIADIDGSHDSVLAANPLPLYFSDSGVAWSANGKQIFAGEFDEHLKVFLESIDVSGGRRRVLSAPRWTWIGRISLLNDRETLIFAVASPENIDRELVQFSTTTLNQTAVASDLADFKQVYSAGSDIVAVQRNSLSSVWVAPAQSPSAAQAITTSAGHFNGIVWSPDGTLVSSVRDGGHANLRRLWRDGTQEQITSGAVNDYQPAVSADGRAIAFTTNRASGWSIWIKDAGGTRPLTGSHVVDQSPSCLPDASILFGRQEKANGQFRIWRVNGPGDNPRRLLSMNAMNPVAAASGRYFACRIPDPSSGVWQESVVDLSSLKVLGRYPKIPFGTQVRWAPDESGLTYVRDSNGVSNIFKTSIATGLEEAVTHFKEETIFSFDWSPKSHDLAMVRGIPALDVVLLKRAQ